MTKQITTHAAVAKQIRAALKAAKISAKVRSKSYSGGSSVNVLITDDILPAAVAEVESFCAKYQAGHFDGMTDCYHYDNTDKSIPQVRHVFVSVAYSEKMYQEALDHVRAYWAGAEQLPERFDELTFEHRIDGRGAHELVRATLNGQDETGFWSARKPRIRAA